MDLARIWHGVAVRYNGFLLLDPDDHGRCVMRADLQTRVFVMHRSHPRDVVRTYRDVVRAYGASTACGWLRCR